MVLPTHYYGRRQNKVNVSGKLCECTSGSHCTVRASPPRLTQNPKPKLYDRIFSIILVLWVAGGRRHQRQVNPKPKPKIVMLPIVHHGRKLHATVPSEVFRFMQLKLPKQPAMQTIEFSRSSSSSSDSIILTLQLLLAPRPQLNLKVASSAAISDSSPDDLAYECEPHPCASTAAISQPGPIWAVDGVTRIPFL
jgi:hypothetical protein